MHDLSNPELLENISLKRRIEYTSSKEADEKARRVLCRIEKEGFMQSVKQAQDAEK